MATLLIDESQSFLIPVDPVNTGSVCVTLRFPLFSDDSLFDEVE